MCVHGLWDSEHRPARSVDLGEDQPRVGEEALAGGQQGDTSRRALEQRGPELVLEVADLPGQRRLGDVELARGATDVLRLGHGDEIVDLRQAHPPRVTRAAGATQRRYQKGIGAPPGPRGTLRAWL